MNFSFLEQYFPMFLDGMKITILLAFLTVLCGTVLGTLLSLMRLSSIKVLKAIATVYVEFIRGTPLMIQLYLFYFGIPAALGIDLPEYPAAILALSLNSGAYVAEIIRSGIQAVDKGQMEAARSLGMTYGLAMKEIIIPQAVKNVLPALGNEFVTVIKESSIVSIIGLTELTRASDIIRGVTYLSFEPLIVVAVLYFVLTFALSNVMGRVERRMKTSD